MAQEKKAAPDWERIEADYRAGLLSVREIAVANSISHVAIAKRAKRDGWERDLAARIKAKADALVTNQAVTSSVTTEQAVTDKAIVEANAHVIANIRIAHRTDIARSRNLVMTLLGELEFQTDNADLLEQLGELMIDLGPEATEKQVAAQEKRREAFDKVISLSSRTGTMKSLSESLKVLVALEREAYSIADAQKIEINAKVDSSKKTQDMTDDELFAIATGSGAGAMDKAQGTD